MKLLVVDVDNVGHERIQLTLDIPQRTNEFFLLMRKKYRYLVDWTTYVHMDLPFTICFYIYGWNVQWQNTDKVTKMFSIQRYIHTNALVDCKNEFKFGYKIPTQTTMDNGNMTLATYKRAFIIALLLLNHWVKQK